MSATSYSSPAMETVESVVMDSLGDRAIVILCALCEVEYTGRAAGYLGPGERVVLCKPDGTMLVHRPQNHDPVNWQPPGSRITVERTDEECVISSVRSSPREILRVILREVYSLTEFNASDVAPLELSGTEADMHQYVLENPEAIEPGLRITEHERDTPHGSIDMFGNDREGRPVIIEVKRRQASLKHVDQLRRYTQLFRESNEDVRGILVAPSGSDRVTRTLRDNGLEFVALDAFASTNHGIEGTTLTDFTNE